MRTYRIEMLRELDGTKKGLIIKRTKTQTILGIYYFTGTLEEKHNTIETFKSDLTDYTAIIPDAIIRWNVDAIAYYNEVRKYIADNCYLLDQ